MAENVSANTNNTGNGTNTGNSSTAGTSTSAASQAQSQATSVSETPKTKTGQVKSQEIQKAAVGDKLTVNGPKDKYSGSAVFRFARENQDKPTLDLLPGQILSVGGKDGDITVAEADSLLKNEQWEFKTK